MTVFAVQEFTFFLRQNLTTFKPNEEKKKIETVDSLNFLYKRFGHSNTDQKGHSSVFFPANLSITSSMFMSFFNGRPDFYGTTS